jgi:D-aminoacyl-tRNA deacylase
MKFLVIGSKTDPASRNIIMNLMDLTNKLDYHIIDGDMLNTNNLNLEKINKFDFIIFASKHKSEKSMKTLSIHSPGNWKEVWGGGMEGKVSTSSALFNKHLFNVLAKNREKSKLQKYDLTLECTHHGPLINKPAVFIEIGGGTAEWKDRHASFCVAKTIIEAIETFKENPYNEIAIGLGGPHYCPTFNKLQLTSNVAISHIIPKYIEPITLDMVKEALEKTKEEVDFVVLDWKGLGNKEEKQRIIDFLDKNYISYKRSSEIKK